MPSLPSLKVLLPVLTSFLFAGSFIAGKYTTVELGPLTTSLLRYVIALGVLGLLVYRSDRPTKALTVARSDWGAMALLGLFGVVGYHYFFFSSLRYTATANTAIINAFNPVVTGVMAALFIGERLSRRQYGGIVLALAGVLTLLTRGNLTALLRLDLNRGDGLMLCAVLCWVVYSLIIKQLSQRYSGLTITFYAAVAGVGQLLVLASLERWWQQLTTLSLASLLAIVYMGVAASGVAYLLFNLSIQKVGPTRTASVVYSLVPIFVAALAWLFFREPLTATMLASMGLILLGVNVVLSQPKV
ncbi:DMT family transporter [Nodosilinea sp. LEGE 06152]|uniref:DMT family transporter n=1 Tax=Nodosilinea sp. LEGE 06152 TaxID=2777966 RepID=UPI00187E59D8|nr:DMT family transporter [Nodosilinea sp. LEGE 06152]MBE9158870.1 DMT family transporter [Nodosilinea sp. LEGE 06152]